MRAHIVSHVNHQGSRISLVSNDLEDVVIQGSFLAPTAAGLRAPVSNDKIEGDLAESCIRGGLGHRNYPPPHRNVFLRLNQQVRPVSSRCHVESNCRRDASRAASREAILVISSGTLLA